MNKQITQRADIPDPKIEDFWIALLGWYAWVHGLCEGAQRDLKTVEAYPGLRYRGNFFRRDSDGKVFHRVRDGFVSAAEDDDDVYDYNTNEETAKLVDREYIDAPWGQLRGDVNGLVVLRNGMILERANFNYKSEWAWSMSPLGHSPYDMISRSLKESEDAKSVVFAMIARREEVEAFINDVLVPQGGHYSEKQRIGSIERIALHMDLWRQRVEHYGLPDSGRIGAALTRYIHFKKTGEKLFVCY